jgi:hypothetical protein
MDDHPAAGAGLVRERRGPCRDDGSFDGELSGRKLTAPIPAAAVFTQMGKTVTGIIAVGGDQTTTGGAYLVHGKATKKRVEVSGLDGNGARLTWRGVLATTGASGKAKLKGAGQRFHVFPTDPLATARAVAEMVDPAVPGASRLIAKPMLAVPRGGGQQIFAGSVDGAEPAGVGHARRAVGVSAERPARGAHAALSRAGRRRRARAPPWGNSPSRPWVKALSSPGGL